jgi:hypothetical protein
MRKDIDEVLRGWGAPLTRSRLEAEMHALFGAEISQRAAALHIALRERMGLDELSELLGGKRVDRFRFHPTHR